VNSPGGSLELPNQHDAGEEQQTEKEHIGRGRAEVHALTLYHGSVGL
jgi:hypothetical protein